MKLAVLWFAIVQTTVCPPDPFAQVKTVVKNAPNDHVDLTWTELREGKSLQKSMITDVVNDGEKKRDAKQMAKYIHDKFGVDVFVVSGDNSRNAKVSVKGPDGAVLSPEELKAFLDPPKDTHAAETPLQKAIAEMIASANPDYIQTAGRYIAKGKPQSDFPQFPREAWDNFPPTIFLKDYSSRMVIAHEFMHHTLETMRKPPSPNRTQLDQEISEVGEELDVHLAMAQHGGEWQFSLSERKQSLAGFKKHMGDMEELIGKVKDPAERKTLSEKLEKSGREYERILEVLNRS